MSDSTATKIIRPARKLRGNIGVPGDKSISHRALMLAAIADGSSIIRDLSSARDVQSTADCLRALGIRIESDAFATVVHGQGLSGLQAPTTTLDAGNSGTTVRLLAGILAGQSFSSTLDGDASIRRRPMARIIKPLQEMGTKIDAAAGDRAPLTIRGGDLQPLTYEMTIASAQVKSAILLAGLFANGKTTVSEPQISRDHTERLLKYLGGKVTTSQRQASIEPGPLQAKEMAVPGDFSSAIFFMAAALLLPDSELTLRGVGINATRSYALKILQRAGANILIDDLDFKMAEETADLRFASSRLRAFQAHSVEIPLIIDEIPMLAVLATQADGTTSIRDAAELRVKESDRIEAIAGNLRRMGATVRTFDDGLEIDGPVRLQGAEIDAHGDHRIAMAFAVAGLVAEGETEIRGADAAAVSYPEFFDTLESLVS